MYTSDEKYLPGMGGGGGGGAILIVKNQMYNFLFYCKTYIAQTVLVKHLPLEAGAGGGSGIFSFSSIFMVASMPENGTHRKFSDC